MSTSLEGSTPAVVAKTTSPPPVVVKPTPTPTPTPTPKPTPTPTPKPSPTPTPSPSSPAAHEVPSSSSVKSKAVKTVTHKTTASSTATHKAVAASSSGSHPNAGMIAGVIVLCFAVAGVAAFFFLRYKKQKTARQKSGLWLESPGYLGALGAAGDGPQTKENPATPRPYVFDGGFGNGHQSPPPPPPKEEDEKSPNLMDSYSSSTALLSPPPSAFAPRPRTPDLPADPYASVHHVLADAQATRPDSGPMLLYSTPRQEENVFGTQQQQDALSRSLSNASSRTVQRGGGENPQTLPLNLSLGPGASGPGNNGTMMPVPMPVNVPSPILPPSSNAPSQTPQLTFSPTPTQNGNFAAVAGGMPVPRPFSASTNEPRTSVASSHITQSTQNRKVYPVIRTYIPTLLDELRVSVGDFVVVVNEFDDGWGFCEKVGDPDGSAGVVPLECLDRTNGPVQLASEPGPPAYSAGPSSGLPGGLLSAQPTKPGFAPSSVGHTSASPSVASARSVGAGRSSASDNMSQQQTPDSHRISARFSSFHVDFDAIRASGSQS